MVGHMSRAWAPCGRRVARSVARLAEVDGAVVLTCQLRVLGFGAKISVKPTPPVSQSEAKEGVWISIERAGGTRHQSAIRFVGKSPESIAVIISQDGHASVANYSATHAGVLLLRIAEWWS
jgi:DNA integrity scanning protein DisA with diadenylate cyclase activity